MENITFFPSECGVLKAIICNTNEVLVILNNNFICTVKLLIGADGTDSWIRNYLNIPLIFKDTKYYRLTTIIHAEQNHKNVLRYIMYENSIMTLLALKNPYFSFMFWLLPISFVKKYWHLFTKNRYDFNYNLTTMISNLLGCAIISNNQIIKFSPLRIQYAHNFSRHRIVLLGKLAYHACPFIFQNINLKLIEVITLYNHLKKIKKIIKILVIVSI